MALRETLGRGKVRTVMREYKAGTLHSGGPKGPVVRSRTQAVAIALSEQRKSQGLKRRLGR